MISQENIRLIVTTCRLKEGSTPKCEKFWPDEGVDETFLNLMNVPGIEIKNVKEEQLTSHLIKRHFLLTDPFTGHTDTPIQQLHYTGWPDHGVPSGDSMDSFRTMLDEYIMFLLTPENSNSKSMVHCSAGIGRTGTTIALAHLITQLWAQRNAGV